jgi:hypothetical protein
MYFKLKKQYCEKRFNMINKDLFTALVSANIVKEGTEIEAFYKGKDLAGHNSIPSRGTFVIVETAESTTGYDFVCASVVDGSRRTIPSQDIIIIDGMEPARIASTYGLSTSGQAVKQGKRRGRRPKHLRDAA